MVVEDKISGKFFPSQNLKALKMKSFSNNIKISLRLKQKHLGEAQSRAQAFINYNFSYTRFCVSKTFLRPCT